MTTLKSALEVFNKEDLKNYASKLHIRRISSLNKGELAEKIANELMAPSVMTKRLGVLTDEQISLFEKAAKEAFPPAELELDDAYRLNELDYAFIADDDFLVVADDVKKAYAKINTPEFHEHRKKTAWLIKCIHFCENFYGIAPIDVLHQIYQKKPKYKISREELIHLFEQIPDDINWSCILGDHIIASSYRYENRMRWLLGMQMDKDFYIPTYRQVEDYWKHHYMTDEPAYQKMKSFLQSRMHMQYEEAEDDICEIWYRLEKGDDFNEVMGWLSKRGVVFNSELDLQQFIKLMQSANNHTRMLANRGFTPEEIVFQRKKEEPFQMPTIVPGSSNAAAMLRETQANLNRMGFNIDYESNAATIPAVAYPHGLDGEPVVSSKKVYPNDPCPCGSGKKYKKCCGKI